MNNRDYMSAWVLPEGAKYRRAVYERQRAGGTKPLVDNPTLEEIRAAISSHQPARVLEVGCGWGRILRQLQREEYFCHGCDVSDEYLHLMESLSLPWFRQDIAGEPNHALVPYDVLFCRGVMMFIPPDKMGQAMRNMEALARTKVLVWEWTDVCRQMQATYQSDRFEYRPIPVRDE